MNYRLMGRINAFILLGEAVFMIPPMLLCFYDREREIAFDFLLVIGILALCSLVLFLFAKGARGGFYAREGLVSVGTAWILMSLFGCLPFYLSGQIPRFIDALFEMVSGFTTTGASILPEVESLSRGILFWRSFSHWLGGMGVLVFLLAIVPVGGKNGGFTLHILRAESPGPTVDKIVPRMRDTAKILYLLYIALTVLDMIFLLLGGMNLFEASCTAFGTAGTGGFGVKNDSLTSFSPYIQGVCTVFMILFGVNFSCYYLVILRQFGRVFRNEELHVYLGIIATSTILITLNIRSLFGSFFEAFHHSAFQVASVVSSTGYGTSDFNVWPSFSKTIILLLMLVGASAGSTGGGMKVARAMLLFKTLKTGISKTLHPQKIQVVRFNRQPTDEKTISGLHFYLVAYALIVIFSFLILSFDGFSVETNLSAAISCFNNIGPGLDMVGPTSNYAAFGILSKIVLIFDMLLGRLEIFPILVLFSKNTWKKI